MTRRLRIACLWLMTSIGVLLLSQCARNEAPGAARFAGECPKTPLGILSVPGVSALMRLNPKLVIADTVTPGDISTSVVIRPDVKDQIHCGKVVIKTVADVGFSKPTLASAKSLALTMDVLVPQSPGRKPLVVYLPGGGFIRAPKEAARDLRTFVAESGFVVASIQYRTSSDGATYRDSVADAKSAIRYLRAHAEEYAIDPDRIGVWGESAGGYVAAMTGLTNGEQGYDQGENLDQSSAVRAVIDKFGPSDTSKIAADFDAKTQQASAAHGGYMAVFMGAPAEGQAAPAAANPLAHVDAADPPCLLLHGSQDKLVSPSQTLILHDALKAAHVDSTRYVLDGAGHGDLAFLGDDESGLPWSSAQTMGIMVDFLKRTLGSPGEQARSP